MEVGDGSASTDEEVFDFDTDSRYVKFDATIGHIEDIVMSSEFQFIQNNFFEKYSHEFEDIDENKFIYTDIHKEYTDTIESFLVQKLTEVMPQFSMEEFLREVEREKMDTDGEIFEILLSFTDFVTFKDMVLDYKRGKENPFTPIDDLVTVTPMTCDVEPPQATGGPTTGHDYESFLCVRSMNISFQDSATGTGSSRTNVLSAHELAMRPGCNQRPNSSKGARSVAPKIGSSGGSSKAIASKSLPKPKIKKNVDSSVPSSVCSMTQGRSTSQKCTGVNVNERK